MAVDCPRCGAEVLAHARHCIGCGLALVGACRTCDSPLPTGARFCPACGVTVEVAEPAPEMIKLVTILFADVVGSTAQAEAMRPEETRALMAEFFEAMTDEIRAEGGTIERLIGDAIMADFGVPIAREDDAVRAVRAALRMLDRLEHFNADREPSRRLQIRIGINTGEVSTGGSYGEQLMVMGDAVNVAARLEQAAPPGSILIGERTARAARGSFILRAMHPLTIKGKAKPIPSFLVEDKLARSDGPPAFFTPLVGRTSDLEALHDAFRQAADGASPRVCFVVGDPGVGKSRLLAQFELDVIAHGKVLIGRCSPDRQGTALWPFRQILRSEAGLSGTEDASTALARLRELMGAVAPDESASERAAVALASSLGLTALDEDAGAYSGREMNHEVVPAWRTLMTALARPRPLVVVVEDVHWADDATLDLIEDLVLGCEGPLLLVCSARSEGSARRAVWAAGPQRGRSIDLQPLSRQESLTLLSHLVEIPQHLERSRDYILDRAEGNPFFLEEILNRLIDDGYIVRRDGRAVLNRRATDIDIPENVEALVLARIDALPMSEKRVLQQAAVVGRTFWEEPVGYLISDPDVASILDRLITRQLILKRVGRSLGETEFTFKHALIRDVAYESLPESSRGSAHATVAEWVEGAADEAATDLSELLAYHYDQAFRKLGTDALRLKARAYCLLAAREALRRFALTEAERYGERAVALSTSAADRMEALEAIGDLYTLTHKSDGAWKAYTDALEELDEGDAGAAAFARLAGKAAIVPTRWRGSMRDGPPPTAIRRLIDQGLEAAGPEDSAARCLLLSSLAYLKVLQDDFTSQETATQAMGVARRLDDPDLLSVAMDAATNTPMLLGLWGESDRINRDRAALVPRLSDVREICDAFGMAALSAIRIGRYVDASRYASEEILRARGADSGSYVQGLVWRAYARYILGDWEGALSDQKEIEKLHEEEGWELPGPMALRAYAATMLCLGRRGLTAEADAYLELFWLATSAGDDPETGAVGFPDAARFLAMRGRYDEARAILPTDTGPYLTIHLEALCEVIAEDGAWAEAEEILSLCRRELERSQVVALGFYAERLEGRMLAARGERAAAAGHLRRSADGFATLEAAWEEALSRLLLAEVLVDDGLYEAAADERAAAAAVFDVLGSVEEQGRCTALASRIELPAEPGLVRP